MSNQITPEVLTPGVQYWNAADAASLHRGWILGHFMERVANKPSFEVKFGTHQAGESRNWTNPDQTPGSAFAVVLSGKMRQFYRDENGNEHSRDFGPGTAFLAEDRVPHRWECLENNTVIIAVRGE